MSLRLTYQGLPQKLDGITPAIGTEGVKKGMVL